MVKVHYFCSKELLCLFLTSMEKSVKRMKTIIWTSKWCAKHPITGQNTHHTLNVTSWIFKLYYWFCYFNAVVYKFGALFFIIWQSDYGIKTLTENCSAYDIKNIDKNYQIESPKNFHQVCLIPSSRKTPFSKNSPEWVQFIFNEIIVSSQGLVQLVSLLKIHLSFPVDEIKNTCYFS